MEHNLIIILLLDIILFIYAVANSEYTILIQN